MTATMMAQPLLISLLIKHAAQYHGDREIVSVESDGSLTRKPWALIERDARRLASAIEMLGIRFGDRCGTIAWNNFRHLECYFALPSAGFVCHTINPRLPAHQIEYVVNHAENRVLFVDESFLPVVAEIRDRLSTVEHIYCLGSRDAKISDILPEIGFYDELLEMGDEQYCWPEFDEFSSSSMCYTSGTTGDPKGVVYQHRTTVVHAIAAASPDSLNMAARDVVLPVVPMFHANAWATPYTAAMVGAALILPGPFLDGKSVLKLIEQEAVTMAFGVPTILQAVLKEARENPSALTSLKRTITGGSACPPAIIEEFRDRYNVDTVHAWGMTETSPLGSVNIPLAKHDLLPPEQKETLRLNQGRPPFGVELRIVDDTGNVLPNDGDTQGALQIRGLWIVKRYHRWEEDCTTNDGWFDTGDIATLDPNGYMTIRDRAKDIIKSGGEWISSSELEGIAQSLQQVEDAAVIGVPHWKWDERPILLAVKTPNGTLSEADILRSYEGKIAKWQMPDLVLFVDEIPRNHTGKILKHILRDQYKDVLNSDDQ